ncbi:MAG TPA: cytochrome-c oxidase, cbb3-type subunit III [Methylophilus sp.]|uniref:cytochrome-c oxidase, cbb3-type subunit III n=1 Tax=Methylophilus sp. TaxID=29541 RepID=UPI002C564253|nr:cytochrome-c oxidase, cbb3-type subunit III [Methylophilus sp.]HSH87259.1 cytochrome-c oxidase, cbb3-type subunit III [Methylophilus sp.]
MSDFVSGFWPIWISTITLGGIAFCVGLLIFASRVKVTLDSDNTNGHEWDGIKEMNNPLPMWWVGLFIITVIFGLAYLFLFPGLGEYQGKFGWTAVKQYEAEKAKNNEKIAPLYAKYAEMTVEDVAKIPEARDIGKRIFLNNCAACHGSDAKGSRGFPNLTDADWLYGGNPERIKETITGGRIGMMPPMAAAVGNEEDVKNVANYVLSLSGSIHDSGRANAGKDKFVVCAACHGPEGKGNQMIGAPNLTDNIWLHGQGEAAIIKRIHEGKNNQMPAWEEKFSPEQIHLLTAYVWGLSNK